MSTYVLVHGAWAGSWAWGKVTPLLEAHGHRVIAVDLPGNGTDKIPAKDVSLEMYSHYLCGIIDAAHEPVILVGHSGAGIVISQVAEMRPKRVKHLVYIAGHLLPSGVGFKDFATEHKMPRYKHKGAAGLAVESKDGFSTTIKPEDAVEIFFNEADKADAEWASKLLTPQPNGGRSIAAKTTKRRFGSVPKSYVECLKDLTVFPYLQTKMLELTPCDKVYRLNTDHAPGLSRPGELVSALLDVS